MFNPPLDPRAVHVWTGDITEFNCKFSVHLIDEKDIGTCTLHISVVYPFKTNQCITATCAEYDRDKFIELMNEGYVIDAAKDIYLMSEQAAMSQLNATQH